MQGMIPPNVSFQFILSAIEVFEVIELGLHFTQLQLNLY